MKSYEENNQNIFVCWQYNSIYHSQTGILLFIIKINIYNVKWQQRFISRTTATATVHVNKTSAFWYDVMDDTKLPKNNYTERTIKLLHFSISQSNLLKFKMQTRLYCSKRLRCPSGPVVETAILLLTNNSKYH